MLWPSWTMQTLSATSTRGWSRHQRVGSIRSSGSHSAGQSPSELYSLQYNVHVPNELCVYVGDCCIHFVIYNIHVHVHVCGLVKQGFTCARYC